MSTSSRSTRSDPIAEQLRTAESLCAQRGRRLTPIRRKVLELLLRHGRSLKAYELLDAMRAVHPGAAPPTVYRALEFLGGCSTEWSVSGCCECEGVDFACDPLKSAPAYRAQA